LPDNVLVYVQAVPSFIPSSVRKFSDLENCTFKMSHSSKAALAFASRHATGEIVAAGFSPILREAVARGASRPISMPLCDDALTQISFFLKNEEFTSIIVGENTDWIFSGASLCGALSSKLGFDVKISRDLQSIESNSVILVLDAGVESSNVDVRRIARSMETPINPEGVLGKSTIKRMEERKPETISGTAEEVASAIARRLRRITR
jgi:hypothetical protein